MQIRAITKHSFSSTNTRRGMRGDSTARTSRAPKNEMEASGGWLQHDKVRSRLGCGTPECSQERQSRLIHSPLKPTENRPENDGFGNKFSRYARTNLHLMTEPQS